MQPRLGRSRARARARYSPGQFGLWRDKTIQPVYSHDLFCKLGRRIEIQGQRDIQGKGRSPPCITDQCDGLPRFIPMPVGCQCVARCTLSTDPWSILPSLERVKLPSNAPVLPPGSQRRRGRKKRASAEASTGTWISWAVLGQLLGAQPGLRDLAVSQAVPASHKE
ncbi:hypothetical protein Y1Q_0023286 [Alligator mississippiensis]|uniref:Uncharacterized protein n=1 Tax=Alligator mississippiensis TaxID=8496 RepID=A0A151MJH5_ALLMI|nr:hypothetical protein Y1Q_0023286 [Alligator mississippiensis]